LPSRPRVDPDHYIPDAARLLDLVRRRPNVSLRELCALCWPDLPWSPAAGRDSATGRVRRWQASYTGCGNRTEEATAAAWLRDRLAELVEAGELRHGPRRRDEIDLLAALSYVAVVDLVAVRCGHA